MWLDPPTYRQACAQSLHIRRQLLFPCLCRTNYPSCWSRWSFRDTQVLPCPGRCIFALRQTSIMFYSTSYRTDVAVVTAHAFYKYSFRNQYPSNMSTHMNVNMYTWNMTVYTVHSEHVSWSHNTRAMHMHTSLHASTRSQQLGALRTPCRQWGSHFSAKS